MSSEPGDHNGRVDPDPRTGRDLGPERERESGLEAGIDTGNDQPGLASPASTEPTPDEAESHAAESHKAESHKAESHAAMLTPLEARVLGCLMEKERTTPDQYPLTLNGLVTACNQKSARDPVMRLTPGEVGHCVGQLRDRGLVHASLHGRSERFDHKLSGHFMLDRQQQALLCVLMLRGPRTTGELRTHCARLAAFDSLAAVQTSLDQLAHHNPPLVRELPRQPGMREQRFVHLLCGEPSAESIAIATSARNQTSPASSAEQEALVHRVEQLETEVAALRAELDALKAGYADPER